MPWYFICGLSLIGFWIIGTVLVQIDEKYAVWWSIGVIYPILWVLCYPIRAVKTYSANKQAYQKHGISTLQYLFGARIYKKAGRFNDNKN